jgi:hypothetical protein
LIFKDTPWATSQFAADPYTDDDRYSIESSWGNLLSGYYGDESLLSQQLDDMIARKAVDENARHRLRRIECLDLPMEGGRVQDSFHPARLEASEDCLGSARALLAVADEQ